MAKTPAKQHCVVVVRMNPRVLKAYMSGSASKVTWETLGERCFKSKAAKDRYVKKMTRFRPGRARINVE